MTGCTPAATPILAGRDPDPAGYLGGTSLPDPYAMPDVSLTDTAGQSYNLVSSPSKPVTLLFFGYTNCPDVCIAVLSDIALALQRMEPADRDQIQVVFVTTDPARDKPQADRGPTCAGSTRLHRADRVAGHHQAGGEPGRGGHRGDGEAAERRLRGRPFRPGDRIQPQLRRRRLDSGLLDRFDLKHDFALLVDRSR